MTTFLGEMKLTRSPPPKATPWGPWQEAHEHAPGIVFVSTSRHGGYHLDAERRKEAHARIGKLPTYTGSEAWLEEDCDAGLVYLIWPEYATDEQINDAINTVLWMVKNSDNKGWRNIQTWLYRRAGQIPLLQRARAHQETVKDFWERGSMSSGPGTKGWKVSFMRPTQNGGRERRTVEFPEYPKRRYYTDAELTAVEARS